ncbi:purine-binding chemotaxis protein CheW [Sphingomonas sp. SORGH_AS870]|uniref:chemotaxis protein CheW n=1 Tax=Sphingomonas sp. SORGH_AS_0870 TaxID=3041801 RepID=UPI00285FA0A9|nr:chemotaxis protein CheW [Sphingomonas sp. SORGH_AS_0870]MDR6146237.1 purine-binding chemotaxis protein CheW [Sphingomonas sp. SORGH_AS_0870]
MTDGDAIQAVIFHLEVEAVALPVGAVREILDYRPAFRMPRGPAWLKGLIDLRGETLPLVDLRLRLGLDEAVPGPMTRILIVDVPAGGQRLALGFIVDKVADVATFSATEIEVPPDIGIRWRSDYIEGVVRRPEGFVVLLAITSLLSGENSAALTDLSQAA